MTDAVVSEITPDGEGLAVQVKDGTAIKAKLVISATGVEAKCGVFAFWRCSLNEWRGGD